MRPGESFGVCDFVYSSLTEFGLDLRIEIGCIGPDRQILLSIDREDRPMFVAGASISSPAAGAGTA